MGTATGKPHTRGLPREPLQPATAEQPLRRQLAKSMCRRYEIVLQDGGPLLCEKDIPCGNRPACMDMADKVLSYAVELRQLRHRRELKERRKKAG